MKSLNDQEKDKKVVIPDITEAFLQIGEIAGCLLL
jgi:hypothetical protein